MFAFCNNIPPKQIKIIFSKYLREICLGFDLCKIKVNSIQNKRSKHNQQAQPGDMIIPTIVKNQIVIINSSPHLHLPNKSLIKNS